MLDVFVHVLYHNKEARTDIDSEDVINLKMPPLMLSRNNHQLLSSGKEKYERSAATLPCSNTKIIPKKKLQDPAPKKV